VNKRVARTVKAEWIIWSLKDKQIPVQGRAVVVENGYIADVIAAVPAEAETIDIPGGIVFPDHLNLHNRSINVAAWSMLYRGTASARARSTQC
jgi:cytosine/adenosine deaminase-related metal-dependent hydrolase